ncbi:MAG: hypothetical protein WAY02_12095, partial [Burkholderiaceae bacterium]
MQALVDNPRAVIGHNQPPPDEVAPPIDFISARLVHFGAEYLQAIYGDLADVLGKKKGARPKSFRYLLFACLRARCQVPLNSLAAIVGINVKGVGEDSQRPEKWAELDDEFAGLLDHVSEGMYHFAQSKLRASEMEERLAHWRGRDQDLRELERLARAHERAALEAETAAQRITLAAKERKRLENLAGLRLALT